MLDRLNREHTQALYPSDLASLKSVFDQLCREGDVKPDSDDARNIASDLVRHFQAGITDEIALKVAVRMRRQVNMRKAG